MRPFSTTWHLNEFHNFRRCIDLKTSQVSLKIITSSAKSIRSCECSLYSKCINHLRCKCVKTCLRGVCVSLRCQLWVFVRGGDKILCVFMSSQYWVLIHMLIVYFLIFVRYKVTVVLKASVNEYDIFLRCISFLRWIIISQMFSMSLFEIIAFVLNQIRDSCNFVTLSRNCLHVVTKSDILW